MKITKSKKTCQDPEYVETVECWVNGKIRVAVDVFKNSDNVKYYNTEIGTHYDGCNSRIEFPSEITPGILINALVKLMEEV